MILYINMHLYGIAEKKTYRTNHPVVWEFKIPDKLINAQSPDTF